MSAIPQPLSVLNLLKKPPIRLSLAFIFFDWLDFGLYLYLAKTVFGPLFFSTHQDGFFLSLCLFTISYLARPIGGYYLGKMADTTGRTTPMLFSALCMGMATLGISLLPPYEAIGGLATLGLIFFRLMQSFALGGEIKISALYLMEQYQGHRKIVGSFVAIASALGMALGGLVSGVVFLTPQAWRAAVMIAGLLSISICFYRRRLPESREFIEKYATPSNVDLPNRVRARMVVLVLAVYTSTMVYQCNIMWSSLAQQSELFRPATCQLLSSISQMAAALTALFIANFARRTPSKSALTLSMLCIALAGPLLFLSLEHHQTVPTVVALVFYVLGNGLLSANLYEVLYHTFPLDRRCCNVSFYWGVGASLGAASLPLMQHWSKTTIIAPGILLFGVSILSLAFFNSRLSPTTIHKSTLAPQP